MNVMNIYVQKSIFITDNMASSIRKLVVKHHLVFYQQLYTGVRNGALLLYIKFPPLSNTFGTIPSEILHDHYLELLKTCFWNMIWWQQCTCRLITVNNMKVKIEYNKGISQVSSKTQSYMYDATRVWIPFQISE